MKIKDGVLLSIDKNIDINNGHFEIPEGVKEIASGIFACNTDLKTIILPNSLTVINSYAFYKCTGLTSITIGEGVRWIGNHAFYNCKSLTSITIPNTVTSIGAYAFKDCSTLTSIEIPNSVTSIGWSAFCNCDLLRKKSISLKNKMIAIKGFSLIDDKLVCRDFIFEENKVYKETEAKLCERGFHACLLGNDVLNYYYGEINKDVAFYEVELTDVSNEMHEDSKICAKEIKLLRRIDNYNEVVNYVSPDLN